VLTYLRLLQRAIEDCPTPGRSTASAATTWGLGPDAAHWFLLAGHDDPAGAMASKGPAATRRHLLWHTATVVAVVASIIGGAFVALAAGPLGAGRIPHGRQRRRERAGGAGLDRPVLAPPGATLARAEQAVQPLFHPQPRRATPRRIAGHMTSPKAERNDRCLLGSRGADRRHREVLQ